MSQSTSPQVFNASARSYLDHLGFESDEVVEICWEYPGNRFTADTCLVSQIDDRLSRLDGANVWISSGTLNTIPDGVNDFRAKNDHIARTPALFADLDMGGHHLPDEAAVRWLVDAVSRMIGVTPAAIVWSGHGAQPRWTMEADEVIDAQTLDRFGRLLMRETNREFDKATVTKEDGTSIEKCRIDSVFNLNRLVRAPGSVNYKDVPNNGVPILVRTELLPGGALSVDQLRDRLDELDVPNTPTPRARRAQPASAPGTLPFTPERDDQWRKGFFDGIRTELEDMHTWPIGYKEPVPGREEPRGWERKLADIAWRLANVVEAEWNSVTEEEAKRFFLAHAPTDPGWPEYKNVAKWHSQFRRATPAQQPADRHVSPPVDSALVDAFLQGKMFKSSQSPSTDAHTASLDGETEDSLLSPQDGAQGTEGSGERSSWEPVDVLGFLSGAVKTPEPTMWRRSDGQCLIYPGLIHAMIGESESGKSLITHHLVVELLKGGKKVAILDYESDHQTVIPRLQGMGATRAMLSPENFLYIRPDSNPYLSPADAEAFARFLGRKYDLIVLDGVSDSFTTMGLSTNGTDDATQWMRTVPRYITRHTGAALIMIDHVVKSSESRGRFAIGSQAKMAGLDGVSFMVEVEEPLAPGQVGKLRLKVGKDRNGLVRAASVGFNKTTRQQVVADVTVDSTAEDGSIVVTTDLPASVAVDDDGKQVMMPTTIMQKVSAFLENHPQGASTSLIKNPDKGVGGKSMTITDALNHLVRLGHVKLNKVGNATVYTLVRPYRGDSSVAGSYS